MANLYTCLGRLKSVPKYGRNWYYSYQVPSLVFCEACYHQHIKHTFLSPHIVRVESVENTYICDFTSKIQEQWTFAVRQNDIEIFNKHLRQVIPKLQAFYDAKSMLEFEKYRMGNVINESFHTFNLGLWDSPSDYTYTYNGRSFETQSWARSARVNDQWDESINRQYSYIDDMYNAELELSHVY